MQQTTPHIKQSLKDARAEALQAADDRWQEIKAKNPHLLGYEVKAKVYSFKKRPPGFHKVTEAIIAIISIPKSKNPLYAHYPAGADRTQADILEEIRPKFTIHKILPNIWNRKLSPKQLEKMTRLASSNFSPSIDIRGCNTLAKVKKRIQAAIHAKDASCRFKGTITIDDKTVVIGKDVYTIEVKKSAGYEYPSIRVNIGEKRAWLRVDLLRLLLAK